MRKIKYHCFFEQSGTFKNAIKEISMGVVEAIDYDILNEYGETDVQIDLFEEIEKAYHGLSSVFDKISSKDMILAFFPCVRFEDQILLFFRGEATQQKNWNNEKKLEYDLFIHKELSKNYETITKLAIVCIRRKIPLIIENPYSQQHYLTRYWSIKPVLIDKDRRLNGDYYNKPTQFWFINCEPKSNFVFEPLELIEKKIVKFAKHSDKKSERSLIHKQYAERFIKQFIAEEKEGEFYL